MSTLSTLIDSYGDLANRYAALEDENAALKARIVELEAERDALKEEVERCEASIRFWKKGACDLFKELEER